MAECFSFHEFPEWALHEAWIAWLSYDSCHCDKTLWAKVTWEGKGFAAYTSQVTLLLSNGLRVSRVGNQGRSWSRGQRGTLLTVLLPKVRLVCFLSFSFLVFQDRVSLCNPGHPETSSVDQFRDWGSLCNSPDCPGTCFLNKAVLKFTEICLPLPTKCWD